MEVIECPKCEKRFEPNSKHWVTRNTMRLECASVAFCFTAVGVLIGWYLFG